MTLRSRLLAGLALVLVTLTLAAMLVGRTQNRYLIGQLDSQLTALLPSASRLARAEGFGRPVVPTGAAPVGAGAVLSQLVADLYVGYRHPEGQLTTLIAPTEDPEVRPEVGINPHIGSYRTVPTTAGRAERLRIVTTELRDGTVVVLGVSTARAEAAYRRLLAAAGTAAAVVMVVVGLVVWWVIRLGLEPIRVMTDTAEALAAGATGRRAPPFAAGTEADRLARAINLLVDTSQAAEARLRRFVADASHELRTPLTTLRGYTALYAAGALAEPAKVDDAMRRMAQEAARMSSLVEDLFLLAELDDAGPLQPNWVDVGRVLGDLGNDLAAVAPDRPVTVQADAGCVVWGDEERLTQAIAAFTANALRHTGSQTPLRLRAVRAKDVVRVEVSDEGAGIASEHLAHLFERFYRADTGRTSARGGSGLGLAIVASVIASHGGRYGVESELGRGSTFWFELTVPTRGQTEGPGEAP